MILKAWLQYFIQEKKKKKKRNSPDFTACKFYS